MIYIYGKWHLNPSLVSHSTKPSLTSQDKDIALLLILLTRIKQLKITLIVTSQLSKEVIIFMIH